MTHLRLVEANPPAPPGRLPRGRHGIPADLVAAHQRQRLIAAMGEALAEHGYARVTAEHVSGRAGVSSRTFYKHFGNLWDCLLAAYEAAAEQLCERIEAACTEGGEAPERLAAGIDAALAFLAAEPALGRILGGQPPLEATALAAARRHLVVHLAAMLRSARGPDEQPIQLAGLDERLVEAALSFVSNRIAQGHRDDLLELGPELTELLGRYDRAPAAAAS
jgi:AcrR family transcriptional regulator